MRAYDLLVFDWDGTLVDSISAIVACTERALAEVGAAPVAPVAIRSTIGLGIRQMIEELVPGCDDALFQRICAAYRDHWLGGLGAAHHPFAGVGPLLGELATAGYLLAVATAKSRRGLEADFARSGLGPHFHASRTVDEAPAKPDPAMLESLLEELGASAERTLMIGDTTHDLEMAVNAGIAGLGVTSGSQTREQLSAVHSVALLASVRDLPAWLAAHTRPRSDIARLTLRRPDHRPR
jgi:phosphoglycolate phosphatase